MGQWPAGACFGGHAEWPRSRCRACCRAAADADLPWRSGLHQAGQDVNSPHGGHADGQTLQPCHATWGSPGSTSCLPTSAAWQSHMLCASALPSRPCSLCITLQLPQFGPAQAYLCIEADFIAAKLCHLLPHDEKSPIEKAAEQALCLLPDSAGLSSAPALCSRCPDNQLLMYRLAPETTQWPT